jgi:two-component system, NtrC family, response regulator AtoC
MKGRILVVDDERSMCELLEATLGQRGYEIVSCLSGEEALALLARVEVETVVTDLNMKGLSGIELCAQIGQTRPHLPVVVLTAFGSMETAVEAIRAGAYDFVTKPIETDALELVLERALRHGRLSAEVHRLRETAHESRSFAGLIGESAPMRRLFDLLPRVGRSDVPAMIAGETGTGKELVAHALHQRSGRADGPFVAINCAAMPEALLESELFGHVRGAFTDARRTKGGLFVEATGGTLFLDEVSELALTLQPKLLRVLQERRVRPVGGTTEVEIDCRILAATNRDLKEAIAAGRFREDLFYRLNVIQLDLPPLRVRAGDILLLAQHFLERAARRSGRAVSGLSTPVARALLAHSWPGNVRELENCIERAVALTEHDRLVLEDLPRPLRRARRLPGEDRAARLLPLEVVEREHILAVLDAVNGNKSAAAQTLGVDRKTLYRKLERYAEAEEEEGVALPVT